MITSVRTGDILRSSAHTLINTVNTVGVMGKGIALAFKKQFPEMYRDYERRCKVGLVRLGEPYLYQTKSGPWIINFPTKKHWRARSRLSDIEDGLEYLAAHLDEWNVQSLGVPPLGCGHGQLEWRVVGPTICRHLDRLSIPIELFAPIGTPPEEVTAEFVRGVGGVESSGPEREGDFVRSSGVALATIVDRLDNDPFAWPVARARFVHVAYFASAAGLPLELRFRPGPQGPVAAAVPGVLTPLLHNGLLAEETDGRSRRLTGGPTLSDARDRFRLMLAPHEESIERVVDLFARLHGPARIEMASRVHFAAGLPPAVGSHRTTELCLVERVREQPYRSKEPDPADVAAMVRDLATLGWIDVEVSADLPLDDETLTLA